MNRLVTLLVIIIVAGIATWYSLDNSRPILLGLDLRGGMRVTLEPDAAKLEGKTLDAETMSRVREVLENRVNSFGISGTDVRVKGENQILVQLPGVSRPEEALEKLITTAQLEFRHLTNVVSERNPGARYRMSEIAGDSKKGEANSYTFYENSPGGKQVPAEQVIEESGLILKGDALKPTSRAVIAGNAQPQVEFNFEPDGARIFGEFTSGNVGEILALVLDDAIISAPVIRSAITEGSGVIEGGFANMGEARVLANLLNSGALPIPLKPAETQFVGATLGQESIERSILAGLAGLGLVLIFMVAYYWLPGLLACIALIFYAVLTFALFKLFGIVLDLPGVTGFILSVGMAVDANILIFERMKEEIREGKSLHTAIDNGFNRAFTSIFDSNVTTWIVCGILIWLGAAVIKGFAITLALGVAVSMFTAITVTRTLLHLVTELPGCRNIALYGAHVSWLGLIFPASRQGVSIRVFEKRRIYLGLSAVLGVLALLFTAATPFGYGLRPGIDFTGGSVIEAAFYEPGVTREQVQEVVTRNNLDDAVVSVARSERPWTQIRLEANEVDKANQARIRQALELGLPAFDPNRYTEKTEEKRYIVDALSTAEVTEAQVRDEIRDIKLKGLKLTVTPISHEGANATPVAIINSRQLQPDQVQKLNDDLRTLGGGIVQPMYQQTSIGPTIAREITLNAFSSLIVASLAIVLYLAFRFAIGGFMNGMKFGLGAVIALIHDVGIAVGFFALMGWLAGWTVDSLFVTAALTILGFSVHDTIVVYDRIRENLHRRRRDESFEEVSDKSITQTFDRSLNTSLTIILVILALVLFGGDSIRLFNIALLIGIGIGTYSSIFVASPLVVMLENASRHRTPVPAGARAGGSTGRPAPQRPQPQRPQRPAPSRPPAAPAETAGDGMVDSEATSGARGQSRGPGGPGAVKPRRKRRM